MAMSLDKPIATLAMSLLSCSLVVSFDEYEIEARSSNGNGSSSGAQDGATRSIIALAAGGDHSCAVLSDGAVQCWGKNDDGQVGDGTNTTRGKATLVPGVSGAKAISAGYAHTCAVVTNGDVYCWGSNTKGQLGDGTTSGRLVPVPVQNVRGAVAVAAGDTHTCAVLATGRVSCWGGAAQLGDGSVMDRAIGGEVPDISGATAIAVSNYLLTCVAIAGSEVRCWGSYGADSHPTPMAIANTSGATSISAQTSYACATVSGEVRCWGQYADPITPSYSAVAIPGIRGATSVALQSGVLLQVPTNCATLENGEVWCWTRQGAPTPVSALGPSRLVVSGNSHTCVLLSTGGEVDCWGSNQSGQIGNDSFGPTYVAVSNLAGATALALGDGHTCVLVAGEVRCWGSNQHGQLGIGTMFYTPTPTAAGGITGATAVAAGFAHTCAIVANGEVRCWGANSLGGNQMGQLGDGTANDSTRPVAVTGIMGATAIAAGSNHTCAIVANGEVRCWGTNSNSQLGVSRDATALYFSSTPIAAMGITGATAITAGDYHTCVILSGGAAKCWGDPGLVTLGGSGPPQTGVIAIAAGGSHTCALLSGGAVNCWGENYQGEAPGLVNGVAGAIGIAAGGRGLSIGGHSCALVANGEARCWGTNFEGQLGAAPTKEQPVVSVPGLSNARLLTGGASRTCAFVENDDLRCWPGGPSSYVARPARVVGIP